MVHTDRGQAALALAAASLLHLWLLSSVRLDRRQPVAYSQPSLIRLRTSAGSIAEAVREAETAPATQAAPAQVPEPRVTGALRHDPVTTPPAEPLPSPAAATQPEGATALVPQADAPESSSTAAESYEQVLARWIDRFKIYPPVARRRREEGQVLVRVRIARSGRLLGESLARSAEHPMLDRAALDSVRRAAPFPPLPEDLGGETREFVVPFIFRID